MLHNFTYLAIFDYFWPFSIILTHFKPMKLNSMLFNLFSAFSLHIHIPYSISHFQINSTLSLICRTRFSSWVSVSMDNFSFTLELMIESYSLLPRKQLNYQKKKQNPKIFGLFHVTFFMISHHILHASVSFPSIRNSLVLHKFLNFPRRHFRKHKYSRS